MVSLTAATSMPNCIVSCSLGTFITVAYKLNDSSKPNIIKFLIIAPSNYSYAANGWAMPRTTAGIFFQIKLDVESVRFNASTQPNWYVDSYVIHLFTYHFGYYLILKMIFLLLLDF